MCKSKFWLVDIHLNSTKWRTVCNSAPNTAAHTINQARVSVYHSTYCMCLFFFLRPGSTPNNLENPIIVPGFFSSGCHDNCEFLFLAPLKKGV